MSSQPSMTIWREMADLIGCDVATIKAVFEVEASGRFYNRDGSLVRRFEPHHFPQRFWPTLGFSPNGRAPWRASLALSTSARRRMFDHAEQLAAEAAYEASSWGAPQIMGFNHDLAGHDSATRMVRTFERSADDQIRAFVAFCINANLDGALRSQDWHRFAAGYNGNGQAAVYAGKIESAYRRHSGGNPSSAVLRVGMRGDAVGQLQERLVAVGYEIDVDGVYGNQTVAAVRDFQRVNDLAVDGIAGAVTQRTLVAKGQDPIVPPRSERDATDEENKMDKLIERGTAVLGSGGAVGLVTGLGERAQEIMVGGLVLGAVALVVLYILRKKA